MNWLSGITPQLLLVSTVLAPGLVCLALAAAWLVGWQPKEKALGRIAAATFGFSTVTFTALLVRMLAAGVSSVTAASGNWYEVHSFYIPLALFVDRLSLPLVGLTVVLCGVVAIFSRRYQIGRAHV